MNNYVNKIKDETIRNYVQDAVDKLPTYFYKVAASSTGKYHPRFSLGEGGLVRHTKFAIDVAIELFRIHEFNELNQDLIIASLILHDGLKHGPEESAGQYTVKAHADIMADWLEKFWLDDFVGKTTIVSCVETHMGQWSINRKPEHEMEKFVHMCDYIASRKFMDEYYE